MHRLIASDSILVRYDGQFGHDARTARTLCVCGLHRVESKAQMVDSSGGGSCGWHTTLSTS